MYDEFNFLIESIKQNPVAVEYFKERNINIDTMNQQKLLELFERILAIAI